MNIEGIVNEDGMPFDFTLSKYEKAQQAMIGWADSANMPAEKVFPLSKSQQDLVKSVWDWLEIVGRSASEPFYVVFSEDHTIIKKRLLGGSYQDING